MLFTVIVKNNIEDPVSWYLLSPTEAQVGGFSSEMATSTERHAISQGFLFPEFRTD